MGPCYAAYSTCSFCFRFTTLYRFASSFLLAAKPDAWGSAIPTTRLLNYSRDLFPRVLDSTTSSQIIIPYTFSRKNFRESRQRNSGFARRLIFSPSDAGEFLHEFESPNDAEAAPPVFVSNKEAAPPLFVSDKPVASSPPPRLPTPSARSGALTDAGHFATPPTISTCGHPPHSSPEIEESDF